MNTAAATELEPADAKSATVELEPHELELGEYLDRKIDEAMRALRGLHGSKRRTLQRLLRAHAATDVHVTELASRRRAR